MGLEMAHGQLPMKMLEPALGLPNFFIVQPTTVPKDNFLETFYQTHGHHELVTSSRTLAVNLTQHMVQYLTFCLLPFVPAFIDGTHPKAALDRAKEILLLLPVADQGQFENILTDLWAACHNNAGANAASKMLVPLKPRIDKMAHPTIEGIFLLIALPNLQARIGPPAQGRARNK
jgi:hypothetical protein